MKTPVVPRGSAQFNLRLPDGLRERIVQEAARNGRSINTEIVSRLAQTLEFEAGADHRTFLEEQFSSLHAEIRALRELVSDREK